MKILRDKLRFINGLLLKLDGEINIVEFLNMIMKE